MPLPPLIEKLEKDWIFKVTKKTSSQPERDQCLLGFYFATPCTTLEINRIKVMDVIHKSGKLNKYFTINGVDSENGKREIYIINKRLKSLILNYISYRKIFNIGLGNNPDQYNALDPDDVLFFTNKGSGFSIVKKITSKGTISYTCDSLNRHFKLLLSSAGVQNPSILSGRRTFAVNLSRKGYDLAHIHYLLGNKCIKSTKKLLTTDPINLGRIASEAF